MAAPLKPKIEKSENRYLAHLPPARIVDNPPAKTVAQAVANSKRVFDATK